MNPSRIFILRPVATSLLMIAILGCGVVAFFQLPLSALPEVAYPTIQVQTFYPGASPEVITSGLKPGDVVVTEGGDRLRDGAVVMLPGAPGTQGSASPPHQGNGRHHRGKPPGGSKGAP